MNNYICGDYRRLAKGSARSAYNKGIEVTLCPCNINPDNAWAIGFKIPNGVDFDAVVRDFEITSCVNAQTGRFASYWVKDHDR